ncbi:hypothetical protein N2601_31755 (plasmid) [Rhizobium sp. CB3060]|uniref:hypothetical protein n=1 Tax=Rhizobium sp. CB3060 TaxID=3138255 RepID=UPI0021A30F93|nr:hypothetical protein [Rhizobium tropici]UWU25546.1 hypothetical protein N2601_31755 [Rhizobium tropici]
MRQTQIIPALISAPARRRPPQILNRMGESGALTLLNFRGKALVDAQKTRVSLGDSVTVPLSNGTVFFVRKENMHVTFASETSMYGFIGLTAGLAPILRRS